MLRHGGGRFHGMIAADNNESTSAGLTIIPWNLLITTLGPPFLTDFFHANTAYLDGHTQKGRDTSAVEISSVGLRNLNRKGMARPSEFLL